MPDAPPEEESESVFRAVDQFLLFLRRKGDEELGETGLPDQQRPVVVGICAGVFERASVDNGEADMQTVHAEERLNEGSEDLR